ncbi:hypothetical protein [uncultured Bilophila sp.]|uniref:OB-fold protein n=1 Tax=uncultured Bilophila sp. TaxID=529385 RepID=UPI00280C2411|nr:hypothetical protein [uncultured Bilophila sp.]
MKKFPLLAALLTLGLVQPVFAVTVDELKDAWRALDEEKMTTKQVHALADKALQEKSSTKEIIYEAHGAKSHAFFYEGKGKEALAEAQAAINIAPEATGGYAFSADAYMLLEDYASFYEQCQKMVSLLKKEDYKDGETFLQEKKEASHYCDYWYYTKIAISPAKIWATYNENEALGDENYGGRTISIKGNIAKIEKNMGGDYQAVFPIGDMSNVLCVIKGPKDNRSKLLQLSDKLDGKKPPKLQHPAAKLKRGQNVVFKGKVSGFALGNLVIEDCEVVE